MRPLARAGRNLAYKMMGETLGRLCTFALFILAARLLGAIDYGRYSHAASLAALALIGMDLGLNTLLVRDGAREPGRVGAYAGSLLAIKGLLALVVLGLIWLFCRAAGYPGWQQGLIMAVALGQALWGLAELGIAGLNALERMDQEALVKAITRFTSLVLAGALMLLGAGVWGLAAGLAGANLLGGGLGLGLLHRRAPLARQPRPGFLPYLARESLPLALTGIFILIYFRVDMVMLEMLGRGYGEIGWYAASVKIADAVAMVPALVAGALLPVLSSQAQSDRAGFLRLYGQGQRLLIMLGLPAALGLWWVRAPLVAAIYGPSYIFSEAALAWLAPMLALMFVNFLQLNALTALGRQRLGAYATGVCVLVNVGLNLALIPRWGMLGAAAATLATEAALFGQCAWFIRRELGPTRLLAGSWRPALACGVMALGLWFTGSWPLPLMIGAGAALYGLTLMALGGLTRRELRSLAELWRARGGGG